MALRRAMFVIAVPDLERSSAFYRDVLGFEIREIGDPGWRMYVQDECRIMAGECPDAVPAAQLGGHSYFAYLVVDDVDACHERVASAGAEIVKRVATEKWGMREFGLRTIDGHRIMVGQEVRGIRIRPAAKADAAAACDVIRRSITELLAREHMNDEGTLAAWLENKTEENALRWISADDRCSIVALDDDRICGFGMIKKSGEVGLLYVAPEARFRGASNSMLRELERQATRWGATTVTAVSSLTARDFYLKRGYIASGEPVKGFGLTLGYPVSKTLTPSLYRKVSAG